MEAYSPCESSTAARLLPVPDVGSTHMSVSRLVHNWLSDDVRNPDVERQEQTVAVLVGARSLVRRGWLQGGWYVLEAPDGRRRFVGAGSLTRRSYGSVVQACLVGAVVESAAWHSAERGMAGSAIDALWRGLLEVEGSRFVPDGEATSPAARRMQVRELARWNDHPHRTREQVLRLLDATIEKVQAERSGRDLDDGRALEESGIGSPRLAAARG
jgi:hypothetical protein